MRFRQATDSSSFHSNPSWDASEGTPAQNSNFVWSQDSKSTVHHDEDIADSNTNFITTGFITKDTDCVERPHYPELHEKVASFVEQGHATDYVRRQSLPVEDQMDHYSSESLYPIVCDDYYKYNDEDNYEYDGDAILQQYSELSSLHPAGDYSDSRLYLHPVDNFPTPKQTYRSLYTTNMPSMKVTSDSPRIHQSHPSPAYYTLSEPVPNEKLDNIKIHSNFNVFADHSPMTHSLVPIHLQSQHQPVPDNRRSSYSELSAHVTFISEMATRPGAPHNKSRTVLEQPCENTISPFHGSEPSGWYPDATEVEPLVSIGSFSPEVPSHLMRRSNTRDDECGSSQLPSDLPLSSFKSLIVRKGPARRRPSLACFFCRERKIACGRPAEGSPDPTCNQCARRSFTCDYPTESHRGQHKRNRKKDLQ